MTDTQYLDGAYEAGQAQDEIGELGRLIEDGKLTPDGLAAARGLSAVAYALLALREAAVSAADDLTDAVAGISASGDLADAVTDVGAEVSALAGDLQALSARRRSWRLPAPGWLRRRPAGDRCDGTTVAVIATDDRGRYLVAPADRPGPLALMGPPAVHADGADADDVAVAALAALGVSTEVPPYEVGAGWREDLCTSDAGGRARPGHLWRVYQAHVTGQREPGRGARWVTAGELQALADRVLVLAGGGRPEDAAVDAGGGFYLDPAWLGWLTERGVISTERVVRAQAEALAAGPWAR